MLVGIALGVLEGGPVAAGHFDELVNRNVQLRLLLLSPFDHYGKPNPIVEIADIQTQYQGNRRLIEERIRQIDTWRSELSALKRRKIHIRFYNNVPAAGALLIDADKAHGMIRIEPILPYLATENRPSFDVTSTSSPEFYGRLKTAYDALWNAAIPLEDVIKFLYDESSKS